MGIHAPRTLVPQDGDTVDAPRRGLNLGPEPLSWLQASVFTLGYPHPLTHVKRFRVGEPTTRFLSTIVCLSLSVGFVCPWRKKEVGGGREIS